MAIDDQALMQKVYFLVGKLVSERDEALNKRFDELGKKLDDKNLSRMKEVRQSLAVQPFTPLPTNHYSGSGTPESSLGETRDTYDELTATGRIAKKFLKIDGVWTLVGTFPAYAIAMSDGPHTNYETLTGTLDGVNAAFTTASAYTPGSLTAYWQGQTLFDGGGLTETSPTTGVFTLDIAPSPGNIIAARYEHA